MSEKHIKEVVEFDLLELSGLSVIHSHRGQFVLYLSVLVMLVHENLCMAFTNQVVQILQQSVFHISQIVLYLLTFKGILLGKFNGRFNVLSYLLEYDKSFLVMAFVGVMQTNVVFDLSIVKLLIELILEQLEGVYLIFFHVHY
jgi:hypothetical protein